MDDRFAGAKWRKSSKSNLGNCVEVTDPVDGAIGVRDSKDPGGHVLQFSPEVWVDFLHFVKSGTLPS